MDSVAAREILVGVAQMVMMVGVLASTGAPTIESNNMSITNISRVILGKYFSVVIIPNLYFMTHPPYQCYMIKA